MSKIVIIRGKVTAKKKYPYDPWYGIWDFKPGFMKFIPMTLIFKARKLT